MSNTTTRTLAEVKSQYGEKVVETATSFVINAYGKYLPNVSFVLDKDFSGDPLKYRSDAPAREMVSQFGIDFGAPESGVSVLFGDFWSSKAGKPHFRPKSVQVASHVLVRASWGGAFARTRGRWDAPKGAAYFRRASSNGGGTGYDYYVLTVGYHLVVRDEELDGDAVATPDFSARAKQIRASFAAFDQAQADKANAEAEAAAAAEEASRKAKAGFMPRLEDLQLRLAVLLADQPNTASYQPLELREEAFSEGCNWQPLLYNEENVAHMERNVAYWEEKMANSYRRPLFEAFASRVETLGLTLSFGEEKVKFSDDSYYGGYSYDDEGLAAFEAALVRKEEEAAKKAREEAAAAAKASAEAEAAQLGLPSDVRIWRRMGGVTNRGNGWVLRPDGSKRECDPSSFSRYGDGYLVWNQILPGELVLRYHQADRYDIAHCEVVYRPEVLTGAQLTVARQIEEEMGACENAFGLDDRLSKLLDRRAAAIEEAMANLPQALWPDDGWTLEVLSSTNGLTLSADARSWVNHAEPFPLSCEGREAQVVYELPAADGVLQVVAYYKWGSWNLNLWWREQADVTPEPVATEAPAESIDMATALQRLQVKFGNNH